VDVMHSFENEHWRPHGTVRVRVDKYLRHATTAICSYAEAKEMYDREDSCVWNHPIPFRPHRCTYYHFYDMPDGKDPEVFEDSNGVDDWCAVAWHPTTRAVLAGKAGNTFPMMSTLKYWGKSNTYSNNMQ